MKEFVKAIEIFTQIKTEQDLLSVFQYLPHNIQEKRAFYEKEMFIYPEQHSFYILTSLFIDWIYKLISKYQDDAQVLNFLDELNYLFEFIDDEINENEQQEIIKKAKLYLDDYWKHDLSSTHVKHLTKSEIQSLRESKRNAYEQMMQMD
ncbi:hypothetical protein B0186_04160 [Canicola haemoglobinophilus]|uniref:Uncharacterized protein n=1 Tax=Canicola haemoglobinophilus TaxID=733 RepID=A0A1V4B258_9PAST|nr:hypothetical protein [Canicola haemoglobinophilus]OOS01277.1 hypothetical protein B0186_04160 [Canicola haemoglobinophilus]STO60123.1 Uncharacterised protein [Canicola haemoglobinophilus]